MRKSLVMAAVAAMVLAGCSQDDGLNSGVDQGNGTPIEFRTVTNKTRATEMNGDNIGDFRVSAIKDATKADFDFMLNTAVINTGGAWGYSPKKFFPSNPVDLSFYAYSPSGSVNVASMATTAGTDEAKIVYTVPLNAKKKAQDKDPEDFLVAATQAQSGTINMKFQHALSIATFAAKNENTGATFIVDSIKLDNLANTGTLTAVAATPTFAWSGLGDQDKVYAASLPAAGVSVLPGKTGQLTSANEGLMILPQAVNTSTATSLNVYFNAVDGDFHYIFGDNHAKVIALPSTFKFEMGKKYNFVFTFDDLNDIKFTVEVQNWNNVDQDLTPVTP